MPTDEAGMPIWDGIPGTPGMPGMPGILGTPPVEDPLQSFRFLVSIGGGQIAAAFTRLSGIQMQVQTVEGRPGDDNRGVAEILPVTTRFSPVTLSRGVVGDFDFMDWLLSASAGDYTGPSGVNLKRDIDIVAINSQGEPGVTWTLMNAFPIGYELSPMDASRSEVLVENITFANTGLKRTAAAPELRNTMTYGRPGLTANRTHVHPGDRYWRRRNGYRW